MASRSGPAGVAVWAAVALRTGNLATAGLTVGWRPTVGTGLWRVPEDCTGATLLAERALDPTAAASLLVAYTPPRGPTIPETGQGQFPR